MTDKITNAIVHGSSQFIIATFVGKVLDGVMPYDPTEGNLLKLATEIVVQVAADSIVTAGLMDFLNGRLREDQYDPSNGFGYLIGLVYSQPHLVSKIGKFNELLGQRLGTTFFGKLTRMGNRAMGVQRVPVPLENQFVSGNAAYN